MPYLALSRGDGVTLWVMGVLGEWGGGSRWALAVLLGCVVLLILAPAALGAEGSGKISGTVTAACPCEDMPEPLKNIEVTVYETGENLFPVGSAITDEHGEYTVEGLVGGQYKVEFSPELESSLNYVTQYYKEKPSLATAEPVKVVQKKTTEKIDAELQVGGEVKGRVTEASTHKDLEGIEVQVFEESESESPVRFAITGKNGEYTIAGLASGHYKVEFSPGLESNLNYVAQFYEDKSSFASAGLVEVVQGEIKTEVNAELQVGGEIEGSVTDAWTHAALAGVYVFAIGSGEAFAGVAQTNASGQYTMLGLASGSYEIEFVDLASGSPYITQYYNDEPALASANPVVANQGETTPGIDAALVRKAPVDTAAPVVSGTPAAGETLSCSNGSWTGSPAPTYSYAWLRDGVVIAGASVSTYVVQTADQGNGLACRVTATNKSGSAAAVSETLMVPVPVIAPPKPDVTVLSSEIVVEGDSARVPIACVDANCSGTIELTEQIVVRHRKGKGGRRISRKETVVLGKGSYALAQGHSGTILVFLTSRGRNALAKARHHRLSARLFASVVGGTTVSRSVVLSEVVHRHQRRSS